jgi:hypothetical protein
MERCLFVFVYRTITLSTFFGWKNRDRGDVLYGGRKQLLWAAATVRQDRHHRSVADVGQRCPVARPDGRKRAMREVAARVRGTSVPSVAPWPRQVAQK